MTIKRILALLILLAVVLTLIFGFTRPGTTNHGKISVAATYYPLYDFAREVGGDKVDVKDITPAGAEPHDYEPSPQQLVAAQGAKVFIYNGATFEPWVGKFLSDFKQVAVRAAAGVGLIQASNSTTDPHFWLDPVWAETIVNNIRDGLIKADPSNKNFYSNQAKAYNLKLNQLNQSIKNGLTSCSANTVVTSHDAFRYYAKRYNLNVVAIAGLSPDSEPSAAKLAEVSQLVKSHNIKYIFFESLTSPKLASTIAQETGAQTATFDPIEGLTNQAQANGKDYISIQYDNLSNLRHALSCQ